MNQSAGATARARRDLQSTDAWRTIQAEFLATGQASRVLERLTAARDEFVVQAYQTAIEPAVPTGVALLAGGAFGRRRTFPYSELDLVVILESGRPPEPVRELLPEFARLLWEMGVRVNTTVLTVEGCVEAVERCAPAAFTLLDRRYLAGDASVAGKLEMELPRAVAAHAQALSQALCELARSRHGHFQNTHHHSEPDVKEGPGGLEDARLIDRLVRLKPELERGSAAAVSFVSAVRCFLHYRAGSDRNTLDVETQEQFARQNWTRENSYFECARAIFNEARRAMEKVEKSQSSLLDNFRGYRSRLSNQEFTVSRERLLLRNPAQLADDPALVFRLLEFIGRHGVAPSCETERRLESSHEPFAAYCAKPRPLWTALKTILSSPHAGMALRTLDDTRLLPKVFPEWRGIEDLVLPEAEYRYTADEFTLQAIERVVELRSGAVAEHQRFAGLLAEIDDPAILIFTLLFHEPARACADSPELAARRAAGAMARIQMPETASFTVEFLIRNRSYLSEAVSGRDLDDPATARLLAERIGTGERLKLLTLMAYARLSALGADAKTAWRMEQLWRAYTVADRELMRELETDRIQQVPGDLPGNAEFIKGFPLRYLRAHSQAEIAVHLQMYESSRPSGATVRLEATEGGYRLTVVARDKPFLFASFAGAISSFGLDILKAEAFSNATGVVLDTFVFADPKRMLQQNPSEKDRLSDLLQRIATGKTDARKLMRGLVQPDAGKRTISTRVQFDSDACPTATLVEIETQDRPGLLYNLASVFSSHACNIDVVLVDTKGRRAIDVFYIAQDGRKLSPGVQDELRKKLLAAC